MVQVPRLDGQACEFVLYATMADNHTTTLPLADPIGNRSGQHSIQPQRHIMRIIPSVKAINHYYSSTQPSKVIISNSWVSHAAAASNLLT